MFHNIQKKLISRTTYTQKDTSKPLQRDTVIKSLGYTDSRNDFISLARAKTPPNAPSTH